jgi:hypothetical protein
MIYGVCGLPGGGKSYYMSCMIDKAVRENRPVFSNYPFPGAYVLEFQNLIDCSFPEGSLICIDEANAWFRNRDWAKLPKEAFLFFMHHRHFKLDMVVVAQMPTTLDVNIRDIVSYWVWSSATFLPVMKKDGQPRAAWFRYSYYLTVEDLVSGRNRVRTERRIAKQSIFRQFDSYYKFVELQRKPIDMVRWDDAL